MPLFNVPSWWRSQLIAHGCWLKTDFLARRFPFRRRKYSSLLIPIVPKYYGHGHRDFVISRDYNAVKEGNRGVVEQDLEKPINAVR